MERPKRKAHKNATITYLSRTKVSANPVALRTMTVSTQTEPMHLESFDFVSTSVKSKTKRSDLQEKLPELAEAAPADEMTKPGFKNKASQTQKIRQKRVQCTSVLDTLDADMERRRKMAVEEDRIRLKRLMEAINSDPPPSWHVASLMWLDVDALEKRIEAYEKEEEEKKNEAKKKKKKDD